MQKLLLNFILVCVSALSAISVYADPPITKIQGTIINNTNIRFRLTQMLPDSDKRYYTEMPTSPLQPGPGQPGVFSFNWDARVTNLGAGIPPDAERITYTDPNDSNNTCTFYYATSYNFKPCYINDGNGTGTGKMLCKEELENYDSANGLCKIKLILDIKPSAE